MHSSQAPEAFSHWDDFRLFGETAKAGSFSAAARHLHTTQRTISRRILALERRLGVRLFDRLPHGVVLTSEGEKVFDSVRKVDNTFVEIQRCVLGSDGRCEGPVRISATEGITAFWLTPHIDRLQERHPAISVEFRCSMRPADVLNMESDLSLRFKKPEAPDLIAVRLGTLHAVPWASPDYLERFGIPTKPVELLHHRLLDHEFYHFATPECDEWTSLLSKVKQRRYWTNSSTSILSAAQNGVGIALLPTFFCERVKGIVPLDLGLKVRCCIWLTYHPDVKGAARVRVVIDWIKSLFDDETWPWFRDEFHPPKLSTPELRARTGRSEVLSQNGIAGTGQLPNSGREVEFTQGT